jgi:hypothetical protein
MDIAEINPSNVRYIFPVNITPIEIEVILEVLQTSVADCLREKALGIE